MLHRWETESTNTTAQLIKQSLSAADNNSKNYETLQAQG
jgi:hypothetical protein